MRLIQPRITDRFTCLAGKCPQTCCQSWNVVWREKEINHLKSSGNKEICAKIHEVFSGEGDYQNIIMDENGKCPFLTEYGLCEIHKELGKNFLSYTCREYPKIARICGDIILRSCKTSCYAVMESLCYNKNCMKTEECFAQELHAVVSPHQDGARRARVFLIIKEHFEDPDIMPAIKEAVSEFEGFSVNNIAERFKEIFGIDIIQGKKGLFIKKFGQFALNNIIKAAFLEWLINGWEESLSIADNISCFLFFAKAIRLAADGAATHAGNKSDILCTMCDIISIILSEKKTTVNTWDKIHP